MAESSPSHFSKSSSLVSEFSLPWSTFGSLTHIPSTNFPSRDNNCASFRKSTIELGPTSTKRKDNPQLGLHSGCFQGNLGLVKFALDHGQKVDDYLNGLILPIHAASCNPSSSAVVEYLIRRGADVNATRPSRKKSTDKSKNITAVGTTGATALHFAAANGCYQTTLILLSNGADPQSSDKYGNTPLTFALAKKYSDIAHLLIQFGAQPKESERQSVIHYTLSFTSDSEDDLELSPTIMDSNSPLLKPKQMKSPPYSPELSQPYIQYSSSASRLLRRKQSKIKNNQNNLSLHSICEISSAMTTLVLPDSIPTIIGSDEDSESNNESDFDHSHFHLNTNYSSPLSIKSSTWQEKSKNSFSSHPLAKELESLDRAETVPLPLSPPESFKCKSTLLETASSNEDDIIETKGMFPPSPTTSLPLNASETSTSSPLTSPLYEISSRKLMLSTKRSFPSSNLPPLPPNAAKIAAKHKSLCVITTDTSPVEFHMDLISINHDQGTIPLNFSTKFVDQGISPLNSPTKSVNQGTTPLNSPTKFMSPSIPLRHERHLSDSSIKGDIVLPSVTVVNESTNSKRAKSLLNSVKEALRRS